MNFKHGLMVDLDHRCMEHLEWQAIDVLEQREKGQLDVTRQTHAIRPYEKAAFTDTSLSYISIGICNRDNPIINPG